MQRVAAQRVQAQQQPAARHGGATLAETPQREQAAQLETMLDSSPQLEKQRNLAATINASPAMSAQRKFFDGIHSSPTMITQRKHLASLFGAAQRVGDEEPLQRKLSAQTPAQLEQGRVQATMQMKDGVAVNDDAGLEKEANVMGAKAGSIFTLQKKVNGTVEKNISSLGSLPTEAAQLMAIEAGNEKIEVHLFLSVLHKKTFEMADQILERINQSANDCPYLSRWFDHYSEAPPEQISKAIRRFAPESVQAKSMDEYMEAIVNRIRKGLLEHVETGSTQEVPPELFQERHQPEDFMHIASSLKTGQVAQLSCFNSQKEGDKEVEDKTDYQSIYEKATPVSNIYPYVRHFQGEDGGRIIKQCSGEEIAFFKTMSGTPHFPRVYGSKGIYCILEFIGNYPSPAPTAYPENVSAALDQAAAICKAMAKNGISHNDLDNNLLYHAGQLYVIDFGASRPQSAATALNSNCEFIKRFLNEEKKGEFQRIVNSLP